MEIRTATSADVPQLVELGRRAHAESPRYQHLSFDVERTTDFAHVLLENAWTIFLVAEDQGRLVGMLSGVVTPYFFANQLYASDVVFYVEPDYRGRSVGVRLLKRWERMLKEDGRVTEATLGISSEINSDRTRQFYEKLGYRVAGYMMVKQT